MNPNDSKTTALINKIEKNDSKTTDLINKIEKINEHSAQRLRDLVEEMEDHTAIAWAEADIYQLINPDLLVEGYRESLSVRSRLTWIQLLRNVFILVPVMVTWLGIAWAVSEYHALLQEAPELSSQPFLLLWQGGFEGQMWLTFEWLGYIDFGLLFFVVLLTFIEQFSLLFSRSDETEAQVRHFRFELSDFLANKSRQLNQHKQDLLFTRQELFVEAIQESIAQTQQPLAQLTEEFKGVVEQFKGVLESIRGEHERLKELAIEKSVEIDDFRIFSKALGDGADEIRAAILALQNSYQALNESIQTFPNLLLKMEGKESDMVISLQNTTQELSRLIEVQHDLTSQWNQISEMGNSSNERLERIIEVQKNWGQKLDHWGANVQKNAHQDLREGFEQLGQQFNNSLNDLKHTLVNLSNQNHSTLSQFQKNAHQDLRQSFEQLGQQFNDSLNDLKQTLVDLSNQNHSTLSQFQKNAHQDLRQSFEQLGQQFNDSLNDLKQTLVDLSTQNQSTLVADVKVAELDLLTKTAEQESDSATQEEEEERFFEHLPTERM